MSDNSFALTAYQTYPCWFPVMVSSAHSFFWISFYFLSYGKHISQAYILCQLLNGIQQIYWLPFNIL